MEVFIRGFFHKNLGDDLFLYILSRRYPCHNFHVILNKEYKNMFGNEKNIVVHKYGKLRRCLDRFLANFNKDFYVKIEKSCQLNVVIGGALFQEGEDSLAAHNRLAKMPQLNSTYILGANFGPYKSERYRILVRDYLAKVDDVCFRDEWSKEKFPELSNIRFAPDIVLGVQSIIQGTIEKRKRIFISVIDCLSREDNIKKLTNCYEEFLVRSIDFYSSQGYEVVLSSFCKMEGDEKAIKRIAAKLHPGSQRNVSYLNYTGDNWREIVDSIMKSEKIIASRFHSMILGMVFGGSILPIAYSEKFKQFLDNFCLANYCVSISDLDDLTPEKINYLSFDRIEEIVNSADEHFKKLDEVLL